MIVDSLASAVERLTWHGRRSEWGDYYEGMHNYSPQSLEDKERIVEGLLETAAPETVWDLGANDGRFSRLASRRGALTAAWDIDPLCVERNYLAARREGDRRLVPLVLDLTNPSSSLGWAQEERMSLTQRGPVDVVMALGLLHHLAIGNNVPLSRIAAYFARLGHRLIVEFVPKEDSHVRRLLAAREDIFPNYHREGFERAFGKHFALVSSQPIAGSWRWIYHLERR
jgi:ribosomal protein L11 methylase PrmA